MTLSEMIFTMKNNNQDTEVYCIYVIVYVNVGTWILLACTAIINLRGNFKEMAEEGQC